MKMHLAAIGVVLSSFASLHAWAGNAPAAAVRPGPVSVAPSVSQVGASTGTPSIGGIAQPGVQGFSKLPGAYSAAIANGAAPAPDGTVDITINSVTLKIDSQDNVVSR